MLRLITLLCTLLSSIAIADESLQYLTAPVAAKAFTLTDKQGAQHQLNNYRGKVLVVNFWATWCPPCVKEMPSLENAWLQLREEGVEVLAINMAEPQEVIDEFLEKYPVDLPILLDLDLSVATAWGVRGLPTTFVVNPQGAIVIRIVGDRAWDDADILAQLRTLL